MKHNCVWIIIVYETFNIKTEIYTLSGDFIAVQYGNKLSFEKYKSGTYFCVITYANKNKTLKVVKI